MIVFRIAVLALFSCVLSGCGGGGGGGGQQPNGTTEFRVTLNRATLSFQAIEGSSAPPSQTIVATWTGTPPDPVYISATVEGTGIAPTIPTLINSSSATATVSVANGLAAGNYSGRINFLVCRDSACTQRVGGSPLPVSFTVNVAAGPVSSAPISFQHVAGNAPPAAKRVTVASDAGVWTVMTSAAWVRLSTTMGQGAGFFDVSIDPTLAATGTQSATITIVTAQGTQTIPVSLTFTTPTSGGGASSGGDFTLSATNVAFTVRRFGTPPASQSLQLHLADTQAASVGAAFVNSFPDWVNVSISGQAPDYLVTLTATSTNKPIGTVAALLSVGTVDAAGRVLQRKDVAVTLQTLDVIRATAPRIAPVFVLGSSDSTAAAILSITADPATSWTIASNSPWVSTSVTRGTGSVPVGVQINSATLDLGDHAGSITVINDSDPTNAVSIPVSATVNAPTISITAGPVVIGGTNGVGTQGGTIALSLNTGTNAYPWTATATTANGDAWLTIPAAAGQASSTSTNIAIDADRSLVDAGSHEGTIAVQINVRGRTYSRTVPVVLNKEGHWLQASAHGAAFSSFPGRSVLTRSVQIASTRGRTDVPWSATSDASWLSVTASGTTGGTLVLNADPTGLQPDTTHIATVTIESSDPEIQNQESIRVAFWASATDPQDVILHSSLPVVVTNPVEPWVYTNSGNADNLIHVLNVYTGVTVHTWTTTLTGITDLAISQDGTLLFVNDSATHSVVALDARTGATVRSYAYDQNEASVGMAFVDIGDKPTLIAGSGDIFDVASGARYAGSIYAGWNAGPLSFAVDPLNRYLYTQDQGYSGSTLTKFSIKRTVLDDDGVVLTRVAESGGGSNGQDVCASSDGARVYTANGWPYTFYVFTASSFQFSAHLAGAAYPNNAECGWNGIFVGGADAYYDTEDVWVYRADGSLIATLKMGGIVNTTVIQGSLVLSGDNTRLIGALSGPAIPSSLAFKSIPAP